MGARLRAAAELMRDRRSYLRVGYLVMDPGISVNQGDGGAVHARHILAGLRRRGHDVRPLTGRLRHGMGPGETATPLDYRHSEWRNLAPGEWERWRSVYARARALFVGCDLIHERHHFSSAIGLELARDLSVPLVVEMNAPSVEEAEAYYPQVFDFVPRAVARASTHRYLDEAADTFVVSTALRDLLVGGWNADPERITVLPNAADPIEPFDADVLERERRALGLADGPVIVTMGTLQPWHGVPYLVEGFGLLAERGVNANLVIVGDGPLRSGIEVRLRELGLRNRVAMPGRLGHDRVRSLLALADIAVSPHPHLKLEYYMSPLKFFEFLAAGKAIVASQLGQPAEIIEKEQCGLLVPPENPGSLADALGRLLTDRELRLSLGRRALAASRNHTWSGYADRLERIYRRALGHAADAVPRENR